MAVTYTENGTNTPNGSHLEFTYTFPTIKTDGTDVNVSLDGQTQATSKYTVDDTSSPTKITFNNTSINSTLQESTGAPKTGVIVRVYRNTLLEDADGVTYVAGSSIRAQDLNANYDQLRYAVQEEKNTLLQEEDLTNLAVTGAKIAADAITADKIADDVVNSEHYVAGSIDTEHIEDSQVTTAKIAGDAVTGAKIADDSINSEHYVDGSIDTAHIADDQVTADKLANTAVTAGSYTATDITVDAQGRITAASSGAIATSEITDGAVTTAKIAADAIDGTKIADDAINSEHYTDGSIDTAHIADSQVTTAKIAGDAITEAKIANDAVTTDHIADAELTTLAGMQSGTASILAGGTALTATLTEINTVVDGKGVQTTISDSDAHYPTSGAVVDYVAAQIAPIGGLEVIANEDSFPTTQPASGVVISIADAAGIVVNGSGVSTTARKTGSGSDDVTINNFPSSLYSETLASGVGLMVTSTGSSDTYNYHKILAAENDVKQLSDDINDFNARYRVNAGEPGSNNDEGDLCYDTNADKMKVYDSSTSAWKEVTSTGDFKFLVAVDAGTTTAATFDGSDTSFDLKEATNSGSAASVTNVNQLIVVLNGVVQKPNAGSWSGSGEGFYLTDADTLRFATAPPTGSTCFIIQCGSAVSIPTPGDNTVATAKIQNLAVTTAKIAADAIDGTKLADDACDSEHYTDGSVDHVHLAGDCIDGDNIQDDVINSEHIAAGAVDLEHMSSESVDEDNLQISNAGSNGQYLQKQSGNTGGLTWADVPAGVGGDTGVDFNDSVAARWGTGNDLQVQHDGTNSYIATNNGNIILTKVAGTEKMIQAIPDGAVELYYDNVKKLETVTGGATITGTCTATAFAGDGSALTGVSSSSADGCIWKNTLTISNNHTIAATEGAHSVGPITLNATVTVNGRWVIS